MVTEWIKHKSTLVRAYFGDGRMAPVDSPMHKDFLTFLAKFQQKVMKAKPTAEKESYNLDVACNEYGVPLGPYNKVHASRIILAEKGVADKFLLRDVPEIAVQQFEYIISTFLSFLNKRKFKKLKSLRTSQASLPIAASKDEILRTLEENQVMILAGDTGCGKSTQLPQYLLTAGYTKIACTQPRRIACVALSRRVAYETLNEYGSEVAYQTRFEKTKTGRTKLLFLTDGLLLRQMAADNNLPQYNVIILDEVHERHVSGDLLVSLLRDLTYRRQDLKLILMSATINLELFTSYFPGAPVVEVPGRLYPIELHYMAVKEYDVDEKKKSVKIDAEPYLKILQIIDKKYPNKERGDALIFLNGIAEINTVAEALKEYAEFSKRWIVLILHSTLSVEEQNKVFDIAPTGLRKCILSTNIAETSVTIDEIRFVIDSGKVNLVRYDAVTRMQHLTQCWISKASAEQRKGRAGRTGPGVCYRMYSSEQLEKMEAFTLPEIKRISLESLVLQLLNMKLQIDVRDFPFLERPDKEALTEALESLKSQGVIDAHDERQLTPLGLILADLPVDVLIGKMLIYACVLDQVDVTLTVAAGLSVQSPFTNRSFRDLDCIQNRQHLLSDIGDPFTLIKVYREWLKLRYEGEDTRKWARKCGIEENRLYEITKLRRQFRDILVQSDLIPKRDEKEWANLSSKERRIKAGEKRKLHQLRKVAGIEDKKRRMLKEGKHFDTIMDIAEDEDSKPSAQDEINQLEFTLLKDNRDMSSEIKTHKLNDATATVLKIILASGLYPQFAVEDTHNNHREGHDQFAHTAKKPFVVLHPNSSLGQMPEALEIPKDADGSSPFHQLPFFGLLLETTKPFLCNTARIPALFLLISARNLTHTSDEVLTCDGFVEYHFRQAQHAYEAFEAACEIRRLFLQCVERKLHGEDYGSYRDLQRKIVEFAKNEVPYSIKRFVNPPKNLPSGIFTQSGDEYVMFEKADDYDTEKAPKTEAELELDEQLEEKKVAERKLGGREYFCDECQQKLWFENNVEILKHKRSHSS